MQGKTVVVTGGTSGIGEVAALNLAGQGARIVLMARDRERGAATLARLKSANSAVAHVAHYGDLSSIAEMKRVAQAVADSEPRIDVLVNNAGAVFLSRRLSADSLEMTFATNHMSYFVVTNVLLARLKSTPGARIVSTASNAHQSGKLNFDDLQSAKKYASFGIYGMSKLCNILFTRELARRLAGTGVTANCLHPGFVATRIGQNNANNMFLKLVAKAVMAFGLSPEDGAKTIVYLASSPDVEKISGKYFYQCNVANPSAAAQNDDDARRLWEVSARLCDVG